MKALLRLSVTIGLLASMTLAQTTTKDRAPVPQAKKSQLQALQDAVAAQQAQIQALSQQLQQTNQQLQQTNTELQKTAEQLRQTQQRATDAQTTASSAAAKADSAETEARAQQETVGTLSSDVASLKTVSATPQGDPVLRNAVFNLQDPAQSLRSEGEVYNKDMESSITLRFKGINITPGGFAAAEFVRRSRSLAADVATPFNSLTMPGASQSSISEFFGSARQSRPTVYVEGKLKNVDLSGYISGDFLSAGVTSTSNQTNSYTFRLRQAWGQVKFENGWSFLGGQMWSLVTENVKGIAPADDIGKTNDARPKTIDSSYNVGFTYARQYGIRLTKQFNDAFALAVSMENPQATLTTHGNASNFLLGEPGDSKSYNTTSTYSFNPSPDIIVKAAFDPGFGHYEVFGLYDRFSNRVFPCVEFTPGDPLCTATGATTATGAFNASKNGGGVGASARWSFADRKVVFGVKGFGGSGIGRYAPGSLPDTSINANGTIHLVKNYQTLGTLELNRKQFMFYTYGGAEYAARTYDFDPLANKGAGANVGYGAPTFANYGCYSETAPGSGGFAPGSLANCTADTRVLFEGSVGFWYRFYSGPRGRFQYGTQLSYVSKNTWSGNGGLTAGSAGRSPNGVDTMVFSSFRYYLP